MNNCCINIGAYRLGYEILKVQLFVLFALNRPRDKATIELQPMGRTKLLPC